MTKAEIEILYKKYMEILLLEIKEFKSQPTEARHLIGRLGEFHCAINTSGELAKQTNQHGYDVLSNGRRISVKTTAQKSGFVAISKKTLKNADDLMIIQLDNLELKIIYYNSVDNLSEMVRPYGTNYEFDISFAKRLTAIDSLLLDEKFQIFTARERGSSFLKIVEDNQEIKTVIFYKFSKNQWNKIENRLLSNFDSEKFTWNPFKLKKY